jgi:hypothetical protein
MSKMGELALELQEKEMEEAWEEYERMKDYQEASMNQKEAYEFLRAHADWLKENWGMTPEGRAYQIRFNEALAAIIPG